MQEQILNNNQVNCQKHGIPIQIFCLKEDCVAKNNIFSCIKCLIESQHQNHMGDTIEFNEANLIQKLEQLKEIQNLEKNNKIELNKPTQNLDKIIDDMFQQVTENFTKQIKIAKDNVLNSFQENINNEKQYQQDYELYQQQQGSKSSEQILKYINNLKTTPTQENYALQSQNIQKLLQRNDNLQQQSFRFKEMEKIKQNIANQIQTLENVIEESIDKFKYCINIKYKNQNEEIQQQLNTIIQSKGIEDFIISEYQQTKNIIDLSEFQQKGIVKLTSNGLFRIFSNDLQSQDTHIFKIKAEQQNDFAITLAEQSQKQYNNWGRFGNGNTIYLMRDDYIYKPIKINNDNNKIENLIKIKDCELIVIFKAQDSLFTVADKENKVIIQNNYKFQNLETWNFHLYDKGQKNKNYTICNKLTQNDIDFILENKLLKSLII